MKSSTFTALSLVILATTLTPFVALGCPGHIIEFGPNFKECAYLFAGADYPAALALANKLVSKYPSDSDGYALRGMIYFRLDELQKSATDLAKALDLNANCAIAQSFLNLIQGIQDASKLNTTNRKPVKKAELNSLVGYKNSSGQFVIPPHFSRGEQFSEGRAAVTCLDERAAFINEAGKYVIGPFVGTAYSYKSGLAVVKIFGGIDNTTKRFVFQPDPRQYNQPERLKYNSPSAYGDYIAVIDTSGKWVIAPFPNYSNVYPMNIGRGLTLQSNMTCTKAR